MKTGTVRILIACGSGVCTSSIVKTKTDVIAEELGIPCDVSTCSIAELDKKYASADIILTVMPFQFPAEVKRGMVAFPMISGINADGCRDQLAAWIREVSAEKGGE